MDETFCGFSKEETLCGFSVVSLRCARGLGNWQIHLPKNIPLKCIAKVFGIKETWLEEIKLFALNEK